MIWDEDHLPHTWAGAFYATIRALLYFLAYVATLLVVAFVVMGIIGMQLH